MTSIKNLAFPMSWEQAVCWLKSQPDQQEFVRFCFYDDPIAAAAQRYSESSEWAAMREILPSRPGRALDLGAGRGISSYALARDGWRVTALEPNPSDVVGTGVIRELAKTAGLSIEIEQRWGENLPFPDQSFDLVYGRQVLHHAENLEQLCREAARVLKVGGTFIATREHVISRPEDLPLFLDQHPLHRLYGGEHAFCLHEYVDAIKKAGIASVRVLNPFESEINLYPETMKGVKQRIGARLKLPASCIPDFALKLLGALSKAPGRCYTFIGRKV